MRVNGDRQAARRRQPRLMVGLTAIAIATAVGAISVAPPAFADHGPPPDTIVGAFGQAQVPLGFTAGTGHDITLGACQGTVNHGLREGLIRIRIAAQFTPTRGCRASAVQILFQPAGDMVHWSRQGTSEYNDIAVTSARGDHRILRTVVTVTDTNGTQGRFFADAPRN